MASKIPLGNKLYLFKHDNNKTISATDHLLISAHGGYMNLKGPLGSSNIQVPNWCRLLFYGSHGASLSDPSIYPVMKGDFQVRETYEPGSRVTNYGLSKYQGSHNNNNETYDSISRDVDRNVGQLSYIAEEMAAGRGAASNRNFGYNFDVLTIRNRRFKSDPTLYDVLRTLERHNLKYEHIHCSFCRSKMLGSSPTNRAQAFGS